MVQINLSTNRNRLRHREQACASQAGGREEGNGLGNLGLVDASYNIWNG